MTISFTSQAIFLHKNNYKYKFKLSSLRGDKAGKRIQVKKAAPKDSLFDFDQ